MNKGLWIAFGVLVLAPMTALANPVMIDGQSLLAFGIVAFWALVVESGLATLSLLSTGIEVMPGFMGIMVANTAIFLFGFVPLMGRVSLWYLEPGVVLADALMIKCVATVISLNSSGDLILGWKRALMASLIGNTASFFVGVIGSGAPWVVRY